MKMETFPLKSSIKRCSFKKFLDGRAKIYINPKSMPNICLHSFSTNYEIFLE